MNPIWAIYSMSIFWKSIGSKSAKRRNKWPAPFKLFSWILYKNWNLCNTLFLDYFGTSPMQWPWLILLYLHVRAQCETFANKSTIYFHTIHAYFFSWCDLFIHVVFLIYFAKDFFKRWNTKCERTVDFSRIFLYF